MDERLREEIKQSKPFATVEEEFFLSLLRTADLLNMRLSTTLKPSGLSPTQYNVLRILRGAGKAGMACGEIGERMITHDPDITRLLDRLEKRGLVARSRQEKDRRVVMASITSAGLEALRKLDPALAAFQETELGHVGKKSLATLIDLLAQVRRPKE